MHLGRDFTDGRHLTDVYELAHSYDLFVRSGLPNFGTPSGPTKREGHRAKASPTRNWSASMRWTPHSYVPYESGPWRVCG